jgi:hypothetical protein
MTDPLLIELIGKKCRCGAAKGKGKTFCQRCYFSLPQNLREALYRRIGEGYEEAYAQAVAVLDTK